MKYSGKKLKQEDLTAQAQFFLLSQGVECFAFLATFLYILN